jgi:hypothetical protein
MHARIIRADIDARQLGKLMETVHDGIVPAAQEQPGFEGMIGLVDRTTGQALLISLWATPDDLEATEISGYLQSQIALATPFLNGPTYRETYEVILQVPSDKDRR